MLFHRVGFTLIELLVVIFIMSIVVGLVAPVAYKSVDRFNNFVKKKEIVDLKKQSNYLSFIKDTQCFVKNGYVVCDNISYSSLKNVFK